MTHHTTDHSHASQDVTQEESILNLIQEGMTVYDRQNQRLGEVETVHFGAASAEQLAHGTGPTEVTKADMPYSGPVTNIVGSLFEPSEVPQELADKLYRTGFVRIDSAGLFASDRYIMPNQIEKVDEDSVYLRVGSDDLVKRS